MRILAIETVGTSGSVAALERDTLLAERQLEPGRRTAQMLAPSIAALLSSVGWAPADVQLLAVATGPGSFTGLRIGVTTAKTFAYAVGCQVIGVHTMAAIASRAPGDVPRLAVVLDAQRGELFAGEFSRADHEVRELVATRVVRRDQWLESLAPGVMVTGTGLEGMLERLPPGVIAADRSLWAPTGAAVGQLGWDRYSRGERTNLFDLVPDYFRRAAAEEKVRSEKAP
jgi:tRNA threonylcarbamoyladenosine biosynthesis protein TsaB